MNIIVGDFYRAVNSKENNLIAFSSNGIIKNTTRSFTTESSTKALVMGAGAARIVRDCYPSSQYLLAKNIINTNPGRCNPYEYHIAHCEMEKVLRLTIVAIQVKRDYKDPADLELLESSLKQFRDYLSVYTMGISLTNLFEDVPDEKPLMIMNYPGIGYGKLSRKDIDPLLIKYLKNYEIDIYTYK